MRTWVLLLGFAAILIHTDASAQVQIGGYVLTDWRAWTDPGQLIWNENRLNLEFDASPTGAVHIFAQVWVRGLGFPEASSVEDLMGFDKRESNPWDLNFREAYVDLYGFLTPDLDLRVGRQRIAWGTGDQVNPTDNLNPDDLEDIWDFGRHLGTNGVLATYYWGDVTLSGAFMPAFTPAALPAPAWATVLVSPIALPPGLESSIVSNELQMPDSTLSGGSSGAIKVAVPFRNYDLSFSYYTGLSDFPILAQVVLTPGDTVDVEVSTLLTYPRLNVLGADLSGAIGNVGIWAEAGIFFPDGVTATIDMSALDLGVGEIETLPDEPFVKYVIGGDYTFRNGIYVNGQFIHGFVFEMGRDALHDYFVAGMEKGFRNDELKVTVAGAVEVPDLTDLGDDWALMFMPEFAYYPWDNSEIVTGLRLIWGEGQTNFGQLADKDEVYLALKYAF
jgi:hypothetical protein